MWFLQLLGRYRNTEFVAAMAGKVAHNCHKPTWGRVRHRITTMRLHEARGYVRARAMPCVSAEADRVLAAVNGITLEQRATIVARAVDHVVGLVIRDVLVPKSSGVGQRRAA